MGEFGWAHVTGQRAVGVSGSVQLANADGSLNGVPELYYRDGELNLTGTLNVGGEINAERMNFTVVNKTVTNINSDGSTKFGDSNGDTHIFTGSMTVVTGGINTVGGTMILSGTHPSLLFYSSSTDGVTNLSNITNAAEADFQYAQNPALVVSGSTVLLGETSIHGTIGGASPIKFAAPIRTIDENGESFDIAGGNFTGNFKVNGAVTIKGRSDDDGMRIEMGELLMSNSKPGFDLPLLNMENDSEVPFEHPLIVLTNTLGGVYQENGIEEYEMGRLIFRGPVNESPSEPVDNASLSAVIDENGVDTKSYFSFKVRSSQPKSFNGEIHEDDKVEEVLAVGYFGANGFFNRQNIRQGMAIHGNIIPRKIIPSNPNIQPNPTKDFSIGTPHQVWGDFFMGSDREVNFGDNQEACLGYFSDTDVLLLDGKDMAIANNLRLNGNSYIVFENTPDDIEQSYGFRNNAGTIEFKHEDNEWIKLGGAAGPSGSVQILNEGIVSGSSELLFSNGTLLLDGDLEVAGTITAEEIVVRVTNEIVTEINTNGSTVFGDSIDDTHVFNGNATFNDGVSVSRVSVGSDYVIQPTDYIIGVNTLMDTVTVTLPDASQLSSGQIFVIKDEAGNSENNPIQITIQVQGQQIDGEETIQLFSNFSALSIYCDGQNNFMIF
tara:strand:- start:3862 stop:5850 length:1989 start_codon:yes stop_codon:yes gene_type:complete